MKKKLIMIFLVLFLVIFATGCTTSTNTVSSQESKAVQKNMEEMGRQVGMPRIDDFFEKKMAKQIFELRDDASLITYAYMVNLDGRYVYLGRCIGFGLPYSVQYTNPDKIVDYRGRELSDPNYNGLHGGEQVVSQADPNGLYMPEGLSATWLMLINEETGEPEIIYTEPSIIVTQSKLPRRLVAEWSLPVSY